MSVTDTNSNRFGPIQTFSFLFRLRVPKRRHCSPADEVDDQAELYIQDPAALQTLPPTPVRLRQAANGSPTYLLLRSGTAAPAGERLYSDATYSLDRVKTP